MSSFSPCKAVHTKKYYILFIRLAHFAYRSMWRFGTMSKTYGRVKIIPPHQSGTKLHSAKNQYLPKTTNNFPHAPATLQKRNKFPL